MSSSLESRSRLVGDMSSQIHAPTSPSCTATVSMRRAKLASGLYGRTVREHQTASTSRLRCRPSAVQGQASVHPALAQTVIHVGQVVEVDESGSCNRGQNSVAICRPSRHIRQTCHFGRTEESHPSAPRCRRSGTQPPGWHCWQLHDIAQPCGRASACLGRSQPRRPHCSTVPSCRSMTANPSPKTT